VFTSIPWRNAWKYQARSYRHWFWDSGVIAANLLATTVSIGLHTHLIIGFVDAAVNRLLCLDEKREATVALAAIGIGLSEDAISEPRETIPRISHEVLPLSKRGEVDYPEIWKIHDASSLANKEEVKAWANAATTPQKEEITRVEILSRQSLKYEDYFSQPSLGDVILLRGSSRQFARAPISFAQLSNILYSSTRGVPMDFLKGDGDSTIDIYLLANDVNGLPHGAYFFNRASDSLEQLKGGISRDISGYLCLGQPLFSDASVVFFLMTDLQAVLKTLGNRGYRASQFEAGVIAGKIYLSAYARGIGASGSTFYDDTVTDFFSPHAKDKSTMIAIGIGVPSYKAHQGKILAGKLARAQLLSEGAG
jgi:hypothetical protein